MATTRFHMIVSYDRSILRQLNTTYWDYIVFAFCYKLIEEALICESLKRGLRKRLYCLFDVVIFRHQRRSLFPFSRDRLIVFPQELFFERIEYHFVSTLVLQPRTKLVAEKTLFALLSKTPCSPWLRFNFCSILFSKCVQSWQI